MGCPACAKPDDQNRDQATILYTGFLLCRRYKGHFMAGTVVKLRLNQQQLELMDRTIAQGVAPDRVSLVRLALREYAAARKAEAKTEPSR
jgi:hypothetical protein